MFCSSLKTCFHGLLTKYESFYCVICFRFISYPYFIKMFFVGKTKNRWRDSSAENRVVGDYEVEELKDVGGE